MANANSKGEPRRDKDVAGRGALILIGAVLFGFNPTMAQGGLVIVGIVGLGMIIHGLQRKPRR